MLIYKIFRPAEWDMLQREGETRGAPIDLTDGYIHFSTAETVRETAEKHFAGAGDLILAWVEADRLADDLRWEISRGGVAFPHLYRVLRMGDVAGHAQLPEQEGVHVFPEGIA